MAALVFVSALAASCAGSIVGGPPPQSMFDHDAARMAARATIGRGRSPGEVIGSTELATGESDAWRPVSDASMRARSGYACGPTYRFARSAAADLDGDGRADLVQLVERGRERALKVTYARRGKRPRLVSPGEGGWSSEGLFAAGPRAVMLNYPESRVFFLFEREGRLRARFVGD